MSRSSSATTHLSGSTQATSIIQDARNANTFGLPRIASNVVELEAMRSGAHLPDHDPLMQQFRQLEQNIADLSLTMWASTYNHDDAVQNDTRPRYNSIKIAPVVQRGRYPTPAIRNMTPAEIKDLAFGYLVNLYFDTSPVPIKLTERKYSTKALCAISPIIKDAVNSNGSHSCLDNIALPPGSRSAYLQILRWLDYVIQLGRVVPLQEKTCTPVISYYEIREVAHALQIKALWGNINNRYIRLLEFLPGQSWNVTIEDIREAFSREDFKGTILRCDLISNLARMWIEGSLSRDKMKQIEDLTFEIEELWDELEPKLTELGWADQEGVAECCEQ